MEQSKWIKDKPKDDPTDEFSATWLKEITTDTDTYTCRYWRSFYQEFKNGYSNWNGKVSRWGWLFTIRNSEGIIIYISKDHGYADSRAGALSRSLNRIKSWESYDSDLQQKMIDGYKMTHFGTW